MKNLFYVAIICLATVFAVSCKGNRSKNISQMADTSQNALDWAGVYAGVMPCADCEGIQTTLVLHNDNRYELRTTYLGKSHEESVLHGSFTWNHEGNVITLEGVDPTSQPAKYLVGENRLFQFDIEGNPMPADIEMRYTLEKVTNIVGKRWRLIELNGEEVPESEDKMREPHFVLHVDGSRISGHGGCNSFHGTYIIETGNRIRFSQMAMTMMFCFDNMERETALMQAFQMVDNYTLSEDGVILSLNRARMAPLARFVEVHEEL
jgi:heat shock protein HslJ